MKSFRLIVHQKTFSVDDLVINQKDYPEAKKNDIVEIYHPPPTEDERLKKHSDVDEEYPRLLLQIKNFRDDLLQARETVSVEQSVATAFGLQIYKNVTIRLINPCDVALDSVELTFKDHYMGRSEMWRLKNSLVQTCVYTNKKLEFCGGAIRCQVYEMWAKGDRVACGVITEDTKVVFRSSTAMLYIFLQMSSEMWDFDIYGNLYFEKAVNGFLPELFLKWKKNGSNHEITIVMFSRIFYKAAQLEEFPPHMRECLQRDYKGKYYEDFYRVVVQHERYDDWNNILVELRRIFQHYLTDLLSFHVKPDMVVPLATNSSAAHGNFLEVLNMSLNVFEKHYLDRSFDRTGQLTVVVTPGVGVFEVDRELTNITKQRIIDGGVGSDLVCVGEQPLHAVPLLKFCNKDTYGNVPDDYSMPHWINLSFYSTNKKFAYSNFVPRIKLPPLGGGEGGNGDAKKPKTRLVPDEECIHNSFFDYDAYDSAVFQNCSAHHTQDASPNQTNRFITSYSKRSPDMFSRGTDLRRRVARKISDPEMVREHDGLNGATDPIAVPQTNKNPLVSPLAEEKDFSPPSRMVVGSEGSSTHESRALINPFDPSHVTIKLTSNRRRWTHLFPKDPTGALIQQHHYHSASRYSGPPEEPEGGGAPPHETVTVNPALLDYCKRKGNPPTFGNMSMLGANSTRSLTLLWGATGEQEWTPALTTGVDWKSLTMPACLPITTDFFPDKTSLQNDYVVSLYSLVPDTVYAGFAQQKSSSKKPLTTDEIFKELVSQRLAQGFQLIVMSQNAEEASQYAKGSVVRKSPTENDECYYLSIGRLFHKISLAGNTVSVTRYRPRHPYPSFNYQYLYRFCAPFHDTYEDSGATFTTEKLEHYNWNYLDHYVCTGGDSTDFVLVEALKYWRIRLYFLPLNNAGTKTIAEGSARCDIYTSPSDAENQQMADGFLKFVETCVNKLKRSSLVSKKPRNISRANERIMTSSLSGANAVGTPPVLKSDSPGSDIVEAMKHQSHGLSYVSNQHNLPTYAFVAADAVKWVVTHVEDVTAVEEALLVMRRLHGEQLIRHASGDHRIQFVYGSGLFYVVSDRDDRAGSYHADIESFENDFFEVEVRPPLNWGLRDPTRSAPHFLSDNVNFDYFDCDADETIYKQMRFETDIMTKSDRTEWGHVHYQTVFRPDRAYELVLEWLTSSGPIIAELLFNFNRKAQACGLQVVPLPTDPLAIPYTGISDPLRSPIFVPLDVDCFEYDEMFRDLRKRDWFERLFLFQEAIVRRFGFLHSLANEAAEEQNVKNHQYIHATGTIFVSISRLVSKPERHRVNSVANARVTDRYSVHADVVPSPHEAYITRHVSGKNREDDPNCTDRIGFLWSWNHMIGKKWRTNQAVDTAFQIKMLRDFREFCGNGHDRLKNFWRDSCYAKMTE
ncbi:GATOR complex protein Iml1 isoform X2 [Cylas formicarius]|uniref:GATOR complex protein Iml1 isoform X2 n=1 Tax=Cylas formicarius TaxID=197179 RepID=UPI00295858B0|nr:GATOR complex protein Iml1 isoform X2 [Cylas formicarius]